MDQPTLVEKLAYFENQTQEYDSTNLKETSFQSNQDIVDIKAGPQHSLILLSLEKNLKKLDKDIKN